MHLFLAAQILDHVAEFRALVFLREIIIEQPGPFLHVHGPVQGLVQGHVARKEFQVRDVFEACPFPSGNAADEIVERAVPGAHVLDKGRRHGGSATGAAVQDQVFLTVQFRHALLDFRQWDELCTGDMALGEFSGLAHVDQKIVALPGLGPQLFKFVRKDVEYLSGHSCLLVCRDWR